MRTHCSDVEENPVTYQRCGQESIEDKDTPQEVAKKVTTA